MKLFAAVSQSLFVFGVGFMMTAAAFAGTPPIAGLPTLFNTGVNASHDALADNATDTHYSGFTKPNGTFPLNGTWVSNSSTVRWVSKAVDNAEGVGNFTYSLTFTIPANTRVSNLTGAIAADNQVISILVNGQNIGFSTPDFSSFSGTTQFVIPQTLTAGATTISFTIYNSLGDPSNNPEGLRVNWLSATINSSTPTPQTPPAWAGTAPTAPAVDDTICPDCGATSSGTGGSGASASDPVNLATGRESYEPVADLVSYNPNGLNAAFQRVFSTEQSQNGYGTPGMARGWVSNFDVYLQSTPTVWSAFTLRYPNGSYEYLTPQLNSSGQPTGAFTTTGGAPYLVTGSPSATAGVWNSLTVKWKQGAQWTFKPLSGTSGTYVLDRITNTLGVANLLTWDASRRLQNVKDVASGTTLLTLAYNASQYLSSVTDAYGRKIVYTFATPASGYSGTELTQVSQIAASGNAAPPMRTTYGYTTGVINSGSLPLLSSFTVPNPTGSGTATATITYDNLTRVSSNIDGNGNITAYTYNAIGTLVQNKDPQGNVLLSYTQNFDSLGRETGTTDAAAKSTVIAYTDTANPYQATSVSDQMNRTTTMTYDAYGNMLTQTSPRSITTTYTYDYSAYALGRLVQVQEGSKPPVSMTYFEPSGLPQSVTAPNPNGVGTVTSSITYDGLGNVLTTTTPGNDAASSKTTTLNYTTDGAFIQVANAGQPLTVTDMLGHVTHFRYSA